MCIYIMKGYIHRNKRGVFSLSGCLGREKVSLTNHVKTSVADIFVKAIETRTRL